MKDNKQDTESVQVQVCVRVCTRVRGLVLNVINLIIVDTRCSVGEWWRCPTSGTLRWRGHLTHDIGRETSGRGGASKSRLAGLRRTNETLAWTGDEYTTQSMGKEIVFTFIFTFTIYIYIYIYIYIHYLHLYLHLNLYLYLHSLFIFTFTIYIYI